MGRTPRLRHSALLALLCFGPLGCDTALPAPPQAEGVPDPVATPRPEPDARVPGTPNWTLTRSPSTPRSTHTATVLRDGRVLIVGGSASPGILATAEVYDPATGEWRPTGTLAQARFRHTATLLRDGRVLVAGGETVNRQIAAVELYDPVQGTWSPTGSMTQARSTHTATLLPDGTVLVAGGNKDDTDGGSTTGAEVFDPVQGTWRPTGAMHWARAAHQSVLLSTGKVLVSGGGLGGYVTAFSSAELYDPDTGTWSATGSMASTRKMLTLTPLPNGQVLAVGGATSAGPGPFADVGVTETAEVYDPATGDWRPTGSMSAPRANLTAVALIQGQVLVVEGWNVSGQGLTSAELYDPATGTWRPAGDLTSTQQTTLTVLADGRVLSLGRDAEVFSLR